MIVTGNMKKLTTLVWLILLCSQSGCPAFMKFVVAAAKCLPNLVDAVEGSLGQADWQERLNEEVKAVGIPKVACAVQEVERRQIEVPQSRVAMITILPTNPLILARTNRWLRQHHVINARWTN